jgi:hypothetical protein
MVGVGFGEGDSKVVRGSWNGLCRDKVTGEWRTRNDIYLGDGLQTRCGVCLEHTDHKLTSATGSQDPAHGDNHQIYMTRTIRLMLPGKRNMNRSG